jgi:hypothetical protein
MTLKPEPSTFKPIRYPCPLGAMGPLYLVRLDNGDHHCRKCDKLAVGSNMGSGRTLV